MASQKEIYNDEKYNILDPILEEVNTVTITMDKKERKLLVERFQKVIDALIGKMKEIDPDGFGKAFNKIGYTGSFYDGIRVGEATEYDLNIILKPKPKMAMELLQKTYRDGYIMIGTNKVCDKPMINWIENGILSPKKVRQWLEGIVSKTVIQLKHNICDCTIEMKKSGPATTLLVKSSTKPVKDISIDLVPVFEFDYTKWPPINKMDVKTKRIMRDSEKRSWYVVPKKEDQWRISFPMQERAIMDENLNYLKYTLRLMKRVRDQFAIHKVASYYIKTMFLWELEKQPHNIWSLSRRGPLFMHMLNRFKEALINGNISFYWDKDCNLIGSVTYPYLQANYNQLNNFTRRIDLIINSGKTDDDKKKELRAFINPQFIRESIWNSPSSCDEEEINGIGNAHLSSPSSCDEEEINGIGNAHLSSPSSCDEEEINGIGIANLSSPSSSVKKEQINGIYNKNPSAHNTTCIKGEVHNSEDSSSEQDICQRISKLSFRKKNTFSDDVDHHFALSLVPHLKQIPEEEKLNAQLEILQVLRKYSPFKCSSSQNPDFLFERRPNRIKWLRLQ